LIISIIFCPVLPSPKGLRQLFFLPSIFLTQEIILDFLVPESKLAPTSIVSGLSVFSLIVIQGIFRIQASS